MLCTTAFRRPQHAYVLAYPSCCLPEGCSIESDGLLSNCQPLLCNVQMVLSASRKHAQLCAPAHVHESSRLKHIISVGAT
jgi:hypothetical protein